MNSICSWSGEQAEKLTELGIRDAAGRPIQLSEQGVAAVREFIRKQRAVADARKKLVAEREAPAPVAPEAPPVTLTVVQQAAIARGECPYCQAVIKGWQVIGGADAKELHETLRVNGIDVKTGHRISCEHKQLRIGKPVVARSAVRTLTGDSEAVRAASGGVFKS